MASKKGELSANEKEQLSRYKQTLEDIRYIIRQYKNKYPADAWVTIGKLANNPKLRLKNIAPA